MTEQRKKLLQTLANHINSLRFNHPTRVAIDGVDTSGKTTLADELVEPLTTLGRHVIRASVDSFHQPRSERYKRGKDSPEGYYFDSYNYKMLIEKLLVPLGPGGNRMYIDKYFDLELDSLVETLAKNAQKDSILLFDGIFLQRPELFPYWDLRVFLNVPFDEVVKRAKTRDKDLLGKHVESRYKNRYIPGQQLHLDSVHPEKHADIVIENVDVNNPTIRYNNDSFV